MTRRTAVGLLAAPLLGQIRRGRVMTVTGAIAASRVGFALPHEHVFSKFGADATDDPQYDLAALRASVLPRLQAAKNLGVRTIFDCTARYFGRKPELLRALSLEAGVQIVTNTGIYGAANGRYIPDWVRQASAKEIAREWTREFHEGIGVARIRPGFMKLGINAGPPTEVDRKLVSAAALTHQQTGMTIVLHAGDNADAVNEARGLLADQEVGASALVWTHANQARDTAALLEAARQGLWISLDGIQPDTADRHIALVRALQDAGLERRILLSHDANSYPASGRVTREYRALMEVVLPKLDPKLSTLLTVSNPARAFALEVRRT